MTDYFRLLGQARRPWLDVEQLESKYHELARNAHPDASAESARFTDISAGYRTLRDPKLRLQHLLALEGKPPTNTPAEIPADLVDLFMQIVPALKNRNQSAITLLAGHVEHAFNAALTDLRVLNERWENNATAQDDAVLLYHRLSFLTRWREILAEAAFCAGGLTR